MLWTFIAAFLGLGVALISYLYFLKKGCFQYAEEAKYHLFWIDENSLNNNDDKEDKK